MYEIELKAHVKKNSLVQERLATFAKFIMKENKCDEYFRMENSPIIRLRHETLSYGKEGLFKKEVHDIITYKRKELKTDSRGITIEVNEELETKITDPSVLKAYLLDSGHTLYLSKEKDCELWQYLSPYGKVNIELCLVKNLGYFLEVELLADSDSMADSARDILLDILHKCDISDSDIEPRYYSQMLKETPNV